MTMDEMRSYEIDNYSRLQLIKRDNNGHENPTLDYEIKLSAAKLESYGVNLQELTIVR